MDIQIEIRAHGNADVLTATAIDAKTPGPGEIRLRHHAIGVNFVDIYHRSGTYPVPGLPAVPGVEGAGIVEAVGEGVTNVAPGTASSMQGFRWALMPAHGSRRLAGNQAAGSGVVRTRRQLHAARLTVAMLTSKVFPLASGHTILVHAGAAGWDSI